MSDFLSKTVLSYFQQHAWVVTVKHSFAFSFYCFEGKNSILLNLTELWIGRSYRGDFGCQIDFQILSVYFVPSVRLSCLWLCLESIPDFILRVLCLSYRTIGRWARRDFPQDFLLVSLIIFSWITKRRVPKRWVITKQPSTAMQKVSNDTYLLFLRGCKKQNLLVNLPFHFSRVGCINVFT